MGPFSREFPGALESVADVRAFIKEFFAPGMTRQDALLLVSELASNAVRHVGGSYVVSVHTGRDFTRVAVTDSGGISIPRPRPPSDTREGGRGLALVEAYATAWGSQVEPTGRTVWFELPTTLAAEAA